MGQLFCVIVGLKVGVHNSDCDKKDQGYLKVEKRQRQTQFSLSSYASRIPTQRVKQTVVRRIRLIYEDCNCATRLFYRHMTRLVKAEEFATAVELIPV